MFYRLWDRILSYKISCSVPLTVTLRSPAFEQLEGRKLFIQYIALVLGEEVYGKIMFGYRLSLEYNSSVLLDPYSCKICLRLLWNSRNWIQFGSSVESPLSCGPKAIFLNLCFQKHVACGISQSLLNWFCQANSLFHHSEPERCFLAQEVRSGFLQVSVVISLPAISIILPSPFINLLLQGPSIPPRSDFLSSTIISAIHSLLLTAIQKM